MKRTTSTAHSTAAAAVIGCLVPAVTGGREEPPPLATRWTTQVEDGSMTAAYPRPTMVRPRWQSLDGWWAYTVRDRVQDRPDSFEGRIRVPFAIEWALSGVGRRVSPDERVWYRRTIEIPDGWRGERILLHFGAVDWQAEVWVNGVSLGTHEGGYDAFSFDVTDAADAAAAAEIVVAVWDPTDAGGQARGKQVARPGGIFYTPTTGIWQTVWMEPVPARSIEALRVVPDAAAGSVQVTVRTRGAADGLSVRATVLDGQQRIGAQTAPVGEPITIAIDDPRLWSPDDPFLYALRLDLLDAAGEVIDQVESYAGLRSIAVEPDADGVPRITLNGEPVFQVGMLDQGYWSDGGLTAPGDEALRFDIEAARRMGFNALRKHVTVEPERWYAWCDRLGMLVWQDMPSGNNETDADREQWRRELERMIRQRWNHPSIVMWVPFNEGWGQHETARHAAWLKRFDPTRLVNAASGWHDRGVGDVIDVHAYPGPAAPAVERERAAVLGEFGGLGLRAPGHMFADGGWGYALMTDGEALAARYETLLRAVHRLRASAGLCAAVYTQVSDVETEANGLLTYDRAVTKIPERRVWLANRGYTPPEMTSRSGLFIGATRVELETARPGAEIRYTLDGSEPTDASTLYAGPFVVDRSADLVARAFWSGATASFPARFRLTRAEPRPAAAATGDAPGLVMRVFAGRWETLPDFAALSPERTAVAPTFDLEHAARTGDFGLVLEGMITVPVTGVYRFLCASDDGSRLLVGDTVVVDNDGVHGMVEREGVVALERGSHPIRLEFFQAAGGQGLTVRMAAPGQEPAPIPPSLLSRADDEGGH